MMKQLHNTPQVQKKKPVRTVKISQDSTKEPKKKRGANPFYKNQDSKGGGW